MKNIKIGDYEVSVTAKKEVPYFKDSVRETTIEFLNELSIVYGYAAELNQIRGYNCHAEDYKKKSDEIYNFLKQIGAYV